MATMETERPVAVASAAASANGAKIQKKKLHGREFYESIGSPKYVVAPMVDASEFAWRLLTRSFMPESQKKDVLAYSPMLHARLFSQTTKYRSASISPIRAPLEEVPPSPNEHTYSESEIHLDGNPKFDRPLFFQFCANSPTDLLAAAKYVAPFCDAVDLNLGCPQGIARKGGYGAFLQEDPDLICSMIRTLHENLDVPVTAKIRCLETKEQTLEYAQKVLAAGASILTVHGRQRHQKGHATGLADWTKIRYLRDNLPKETVIIANGNILQHDDIAKCLEETGADAVMSAEGNLYDPSIFAEGPPVGQEGREYWRGPDGKGGYRVDAVFRRYMDIIYKYVLEVEGPKRSPLYIPGDPEPEPTVTEAEKEDDKPAAKKRRKDQVRCSNPNLCAMQGHLFNLLRPLVTKHTDIRDALARCRAGDVPAFENVLQMVERVVRIALRDGDDGIVVTKTKTKTGVHQNDTPEPSTDKVASNGTNNGTAPPSGTATPLTEESHPADYIPPSSLPTIERCRRPWWVAQPYVRPLPEEAFAKGSLQLTKKQLAAKEAEKLATESAAQNVENGGQTKRKRSPSPVQESAADVQAV